MVVAGPVVPVEKSVHANRILGVVEESDLRELVKERGVELFPGNVAGAVEPDGWPEALNRRLRQQVEQLGLKTGDEESVVDEVDAARRSRARAWVGICIRPLE